MSTDVRKVAAVVVTYNRLEKLKKVLASLESQTRLPQMLVIVNNAATDGTAEYLQEYAQRFALSDSMQLDIVMLEKMRVVQAAFLLACVDLMSWALITLGFLMMTVIRNLML